MSAVQARFRRLVALYPTTWQAEHGEAFLGVMLDVADAEGRTGPTARERISALRHAASVWRRELGRQAGTDPVVGSLSWAGPAGLAGGSAVALVGLAIGDGPAVLGIAPGPPSAMLLLGPAWLLALTAMLTGRDRLSHRVLAGLVAVQLPLVPLVVAERCGLLQPGADWRVHLAPAARDAVSAVLDGPHVQMVLSTVPGLALLVPLLTCAAAALLGGPARTRSGRRRTGWLTVAGATAVVGVDLALGAPTGGYPDWPLSAGGLALIDAPLAAGAAVALTAGLLLLRSRPGVLLAAAVVGGPWAGGFVFTHLRADVPRVFPDLLVPLFGDLLAPLAVAVVLVAVVTAHRLRRDGGVTA